MALVSSQQEVMNHNGRRVSKSKTEAAIMASLPPGSRLIRINWNKGVKVHVADTHGRVQVIQR
jgi:hypothetical protein